MTIDIKNMPLDAVLGWLDAPKTDENRNVLYLIFHDYKVNLMESLGITVNDDKVQVTKSKGYI
jgi:hypothetical protein